MNLVVYIPIFILGTLVGSFLNVVTLRYGTDRGVVRERSSCPSCKKNLSPFELVPILSFVFQKGKCRKCKAKISWQYPLVEFLTGLVFLLVFFNIFFHQGNSLILSRNFLDMGTIGELFFYWTIFSILIAISVYDFHHKIIPDEFVFSFIALSFLVGFLEFLNSGFLAWLLAGPLIAAPFFIIWFISGGRWMGFGDVKLALGIGWFLGLVGGIYAILWSFWIGGAVAIVLLLSKNFLSTLPFKGALFSELKGLTIKSEIPFGPFLVLGTMIYFFAKPDFLGLEMFFKLIF